MEEEASIKFMLLLFCGTYVLRVGFAFVLHFKKHWVHDLFEENNNLFCLAVLLLWTTWDTVPMLSIIMTHYKNFKSFRDENFHLNEQSLEGYDGYLDESHSSYDHGSDGGEN